jgi:hypothetical protein
MLDAGCEMHKREENALARLREKKFGIGHGMW